MRGKQGSAGNKGAVHGITPAGAGKTTFLAFLWPPPKDHPRRCGENIFSLSFLCNLSGSPPQVRGKLLLYGFFNLLLRDHPRRCGENISSFLLSIRKKGSPPQVRGKLYRCLLFYRIPWITPAGAGKTLKRIRPLIFIRDHPRRCGENCCSAKLLYTFQGSPPQVRGKRNNFE